MKVADKVAKPAAARVKVPQHEDKEKKQTLAGTQTLVRGLEVG